MSARSITRAEARRNTYKVAVDTEEPRKKREEEVVERRRSKRESVLNKRRKDAGTPQSGQESPASQRKTRANSCNADVERSNASSQVQSESEPDIESNSEFQGPGYTKQVHSNIDASSSKIRESGAKRKKPPTSSKAPNSGNNINLIDIIRNQGELVSQAAKDWVERYELDKTSALSELLMMLFQTCGVEYKENEGPLDEVDVDSVVGSLVNQARDGNIVDYFRAKQKELKNFKENILLFWDTLVLECQDGPLFDQILMEKCMDYVIALSCTTPRVFRQVTTLVGLQLVTSLVSVAKTLCGQRETTQRQLNAEKRKRKDGPRLESLNRTLSITHEKITTAEEMMRKLFTGLFMHRYRDVDPDIRTACIQAIGSWILSYPSLFLQDLYLKYIGWNLNDKNAVVRKTSIMALQMLYEVDDNVPSLGLFTERFCNRMIELADDIDISVAVSAIGLIKQLLRHQLIADDELGSLYDLLTDESSSVRRAVGELVYDHLIAQKFSSSQPLIKGSANDVSELHIGRLLLILKEFSTDPILADYVIDSLWEDMKAMKDWKCIISFLLDDNPRNELTEKDATNLVRILSASVKRAVGEKIVPFVDSKRPSLSKAQKDALENNKRDLTVAMMKHYPQLLRKYLADKAKIPFLVEIITHMNLELFSLKRQEQSFITVLQLIKDAFFKHGKENALKSCVKALIFCATESQADLQDSAQSKLKELEDELVIKLRSAIKQAGVTEDEYALVVNLRRLHQLQLLKFVSNEVLFSDMLGVVKDFSNIDDEVISLVLINMYLHVLWSFRSIQSENPSEAATDSLFSKCESLMNQLNYFTDNVLECWEQGTARHKLTSTVCVLLSDLWSFLSKVSPVTSRPQNMSFSPNDTLVKKFWQLTEWCLKTSANVDDEEDMNETLDEITQKEVVVNAAAKLVVHDVVSKDFLCPQIISHSVLHERNVANIIDHLITILKKTPQRQRLPQIYIDAVKMAYERHQSEASKNSEDWGAGKQFKLFKDLACHLASTFSGVTYDKNKADILTIIENGLVYAFTDVPQHLLFLEAVLQFALQLPASDIQEIITDVRKKAEGINTDEDPSGWRPYFIFIDSLQEKCPGDESNYGEKEKNIPRTRKGRPTKRKRSFDRDDTTDDVGHDSASDADAVEDDGTR